MKMKYNPSLDYNPETDGCLVKRETEELPSNSATSSQAAVIWLLLLLFCICIMLVFSVGRFKFNGTKFVAESSDEFEILCRQALLFIAPYRNTVLKSIESVSHDCL